LVAPPPKFENPHARDALTPGEWRLILAPKPSAAAVLYLTIPPEANGGIRVEKYSTRFGRNFEKHIDATGVATWWKLVKIRSTEV
jgi:hypothetical protein